VQPVEVIERPVDAVGGWKLIGARSRALGGRHLCRRREPGLRGGAPRHAAYHELVIGCDDPEDAAALLAPIAS